MHVLIPIKQRFKIIALKKKQKIKKALINVFYGFRPAKSACGGSILGLS
jgi:hypothetical protein